MKHPRHGRTVIFRRLGLAVVLTFALISSGCNALKRGDYKKQTDESALLQEIGFRVADNAGFNDTLPTDAVYRLKVNESVITINVPYVTDTTVPLRLHFKTVGSDPSIRVGIHTGPDPWDITPWESGVIELTFNNPGAFDPWDRPLEHSFRVCRVTEDGAEQIRDYNVRVNKVFYPVLLNPYHAQQVNPLHLRVGFVDEKGDPIDALTDPAAGEWNPNEKNPEYDHILLNLDDPANSPPSYRYSGPPDDPVHYTLLPLPDGWEIIARPLTPQEHKIFLPERIFYDEHGYLCAGREKLDTNQTNSPFGTFIRFTYDPPPIYLSNRVGNDLNDGLTKSTPVATWEKASNLLDLHGLTSLYIEGSTVEYDTDGYETIGPGLPKFSVYGGFRPGFNVRYAPEDESGNARTVLTDSNQPGSASPISPTAVLIYNGVGDDFVLDQVTLRSGSTGNNASALLLTGNSTLRINHSILISPQSDQPGSAALTAAGINPGPGPRITLSQIIGYVNGTGDIRAVYTDNANLAFEGTMIVGGETDGISRGIEAHNQSHIKLDWSLIQAGVFHSGDSIVNSLVEAENVGVFLNNSEVNLNTVLVEAYNALNFAGAVYSTVPAGGTAASFINSSTLVTGPATESSGLKFTNLNNSQLKLYNSVILANKGSGTDQAFGVRLSNMQATHIMNNSIQVRKGDSELSTAGIYVESSQLGADADIFNNLIWSQDTPDFRALMGQGPFGNISLYDVGNNNIWSGAGAAGMDLGDANGFQSLPVIHLNNGAYPAIDGNVSISVDVRTSYTVDGFFDGDQQNIGRVQNTIPADVRFGGRDLSSVIDYPFQDPDNTDKRDRKWQQRTGYAKVYWSIGPYEYDDTSPPSIIHVAPPTNGGDDGHPLGTAQRPFATLAKAYQTARTAGQPRDDTYAVRLAAGTYDMNGPPVMPAIAIADSLNIEGGWNSSFSSHNPSSYETVFRRSTPGPVLVFDSNNVHGGLQLNTVTLENVSTGSTTLQIQFGAAPTISGCIIKGSSSVANSVALQVDGASPTVRGGTIRGGSPLAGSSTALYILNMSYPLIENSAILGGSVPSNSYGIFVTNNAAPVIHDNDITAGNAGFSYGIHMPTPGNGTELNNNRIVLGTGTTTSTGIRIANTAVGDWIGIQNNRLSGGSGGDMYGIDLVSARGSDLSDNDIDIGPSTGISYGVSVLNTDGFSILDNRIRGGISAVRSYGLYLMNPGNAIVSENRISGGSGPRSYGIYGENPSGVLQITRNSVFGGNAVNNAYGIQLLSPVSSILVNNIVHGGVNAGTESIGIDLINGNNTLLYSNTVFSGQKDVPAGLVAAIRGTGTNHQFVNNLIMAGRGGLPASSLGFLQPGAVPMNRFFNNLIVGTAPGNHVPYRVDIPPSNISDIPSLDLLLGPIVSQGNIIDFTRRPTDYLKNFGSPVTGDQFMAVDWHLKTSSPSGARTGGYDLSTDPLYPFSWDRDWKTRTAPWSIGAYEY